MRGLTLTGLTQRYETALGLAELILIGQSIIPTGERQRGLGVIFSMPKIWERYVFLAVRNTWPSNYEVEANYHFELSAGALPAEADVVVRGREGICALYDAKYKAIERAPERGDLYQMVTYCERLRLGEATLVLPGPPSRASVLIGNRVVHVVGLPGPSAATAKLPRLCQQARGGACARSHIPEVAANPAL